jgi:hypothetical protein
MRCDKDGIQSLEPRESLNPIHELGHDEVSLAETFQSCDAYLPSIRGINCPMIEHLRSVGELPRELTSRKRKKELKLDTCKRSIKLRSNRSEWFEARKAFQVKDNK